MVGVPGKYKGCETCRRRRVKCDNARPYCRKCSDTGRECEGYQRAMTFITATIDDGGRCSSHPPRQLQSSSRKAKSTEEPVAFEMPRLTLCKPLAPAWDELITLSDARSGTFQLKMAAVHTTFHSLGQSAGLPFSISLPPYGTSDIVKGPVAGGFEAPCRCLMSIAPSSGSSKTGGEFCLFLYEQYSNTSKSIENNPAWPLGHSIGSQQLTPQNFQSFPAHHYFVRIFRPSAICEALISRQTTFLASMEWVTIPWQVHGKTDLDRLFDIIVLLPSILERTDQTLPMAPTQTRRRMAQDLLSNCLIIERQFDEWYNMAIQGGSYAPYSYWVVEAADTSRIPFVESYAFRDGTTSVMFVYYWMALILLHRCMENIHRSIFQPVLDAYPNMYPDLPPHLVIDPEKYQHRRELAANICRSLDFLLNSTTQPDILAAPLSIVQDTYREVTLTSRDGELEMMWCEDFRARLVGRGSSLSEVWQGKQWVELASF